MLEQLLEYFIEVHGVVFEAAKDNKSYVVGRLEHIKSVLVGFEVAECGRVLDRREVTAEPRHFDSCSNSIHNPILFVQKIVVIYCLWVITQVAIVEESVEIVKNHEFVDGDLLHQAGVIL